MSEKACPECVAGKHPNCDGSSWDDALDQPSECPCAAFQHAPVCRECRSVVPLAQRADEVFWASGLCLACLHGPVPS